MSSNTKIKNYMIEKYGPECWIDKLHLRLDNEPRKYTSKAQMKRMKALTYHHIKERRNGGKSTEENGALLSEENHLWFNKQPPEVQKKLNKIFQEYKSRFNALQNRGMPTDIEPYSLNEFITLAKNRSDKYNRAAKKREDRRRVKEEMEDYLRE